MRYFFLIYALVALLLLAVFPIRGGFSKETPREVFPDMDHQDKVRPQRASTFFQDGMGSRKPVSGTVPQGFEPLSLDSTGAVDNTIPAFSFVNDEGYVFTGKNGPGELDFGKGIPSKELGLTSTEKSLAFIKRGEERFKVNCVVCHGASGNGKGTAAFLGYPAIADLLSETKGSEQYADGKLYNTIANGQGLMPALGHNISVKDRWAIVAYVRTLQESRSANIEDVKDVLKK